MRKNGNSKFSMKYRVPYSPLSIPHLRLAAALIALLAASPAIAAQQAPAGYLSVEELARRYDLKLRLLNKDKGDPFVAHLTRGDHKLTLHRDIRMVARDGESVLLPKPVLATEGVLFVPIEIEETLSDWGLPVNDKRRERTARQYSIVIDAGHGGKDPGAIGLQGTREKTVNLDIAKRVTGKLKARGIKAIMAR